MAAKVIKEPIEVKQGFPLKLTRNGLIEIIILTLIVAVAIFLRLQPLQWGAYLNEYDPFFNYRAADYVAKNGYAAWYSWIDTLSWYPMGRDISLQSYPGIPFSGVLVWQLTNAIGVKADLYSVCLYFPLLMASLTVIVVYLLGKDLAGGAAGLFSALLIALNPSYISRTVIGFFDTENIGILAIASTSLCFLRSIDGKRGLLERVIYAVFGGIAYGWLNASWGAARYIPGLFALFIVLSIITGKFETKQITSYSIVNGIGLIIAGLYVPHLGWSYFLNVENLAAIGVVAFAIAYDNLKTRMNDEKLRVTLLGGILLIGVLLIALPLVGIGNAIGGKFLRVLNPFEETNVLFNSVGEHKLSTWANFFEDWGIALALGLLGAYYTVKNLDTKKLFMLLFYLTTLYFSGTLVRILLIFAIPAVIAAANETERKKRVVFGVNKAAAIIFLVVICISFIPQIFIASTNANQPGPYADSMVPIYLNGKFPDDWHKSLEWLKTNTPEGSVIATWWDYGYWIETIAQRPTIIDGSTQTPYPIMTMGKIMMSPQNVSLPLLNKFGADYILVFNTFNPNDPTQAWPYGLNARWVPMAEIAGIDVQPFVGQDAQGNYGYTNKFWNTTFAKLSYSSSNPLKGPNSHFKIAFESNYKWVLIYKIEP
ncbi:MAG: glycosyltransferase family 39 protein [Candidatus Bathyarchaeota archaeon]|nr:glycosyltransferase family 39 protein [Candidatus Bathyarchaeota archaeon]